MYKVDFIRGFAYRGILGFVIQMENNRLYVVDGGEKVWLTADNYSLMNEREVFAQCVV